jgi:hypothetical protein
MTEEAWKIESSTKKKQIRSKYVNCIIELSVKQPCLHLYLWASFHPPAPLSVISAKKDILLNLSMKCWNSAFNVRGPRLIIVVVQLGAVKIYAAAVEARRKKERQDETQTWEWE